MLKKKRLTLNLFASLIVLASLSAAVTFATAQRTALTQPRLSAVEIERAADAPSLEQAVLRLAAEKLRKEGGSPEVVEMPLTVRVRSLPSLGCHETCIRQGTKYAACTNHCPKGANYMQ